MAWRLESGTWKEDLLGRAEGVDRQVFSPDGRLLAIARSGGDIRLDAQGRGESRPLPGHSGAKILSLAFSRDGRLVAAGREDKSVSVWEAATGEAVAEFGDHDGPVVFIDFCLDGRTLVGCEREGVLWTRRAAPGSPRRLLPGAEHQVERACPSPDGLLLATWSSDQPISIWNLSAGRKENSYQISGRGVEDVAFTDGGESLIVRRKDGELRLWNFRHSPDSYRRLDGHRGREAWTLAFHPGGWERACLRGRRRPRAALGPCLRTRARWPAGAPPDRDLHRLPRRRRSPRERQPGRDAEDLGPARRWPRGRQDRASIDRLLHPRRQAPCAGRRRDGRLLAAAGSAGKIYLQEIAKAGALREVAAHPKAVHSLAFAPSNPWIASASDDRTVGMWTSTRSGSPTRNRRKAR